MLQDLTGIEIAPQRQNFFVTRLSVRLRTRGLASLADYAALVEANVDGIRDEFVDSLTTNVSSFFRQAGQFARLEAEILPALLHRAR
ncbi:MAG: hypothetical protein ACU0DW_15945, partial [Shimia sp.]